MSGRDLLADPADDDARRQAALVEAERREEAEGEDFEAFWAELDRQGTKIRNVFGVDVELPPALPLKFEVAAQTLNRSKDPDDTRKMIGLLFGEGALQQWTDRGMDLDQFGVILMWGTANARTPRSMTLRRAYEVYQARKAELEANPQGKATGPAPAGGGPSSGTGPS